MLSANAHYDYIERVYTPCLVSIIIHFVLKQDEVNSDWEANSDVKNIIIMSSAEGCSHCMIGMKG